MPSPEFERLVDQSPINSRQTAMRDAHEQWERARLAWRLAFGAPRPTPAERAEIEQEMYDLHEAQHRRGPTRRETPAAERTFAWERQLVTDLIRAAKARSEHGIGRPPSLAVRFTLPSVADLRESLRWTEARIAEALAAAGEGEKA